MAYLDELTQIWQMVRDSFRPELSDTITDLFLGGLRVTGMEEDSVVIMTADSAIIVRTVTAKYKAEIEKRFSDILGYDITVRLCYVPESDEQPFVKSAAPGTADIRGTDAIASDATASSATASGATASGATAPGGTPATQSREERRTNGATSDRGGDNFARNTAGEDGPDKSHTSTSIGSTQPPFNFEYTFENFIVGSSNKFAHAACLAVADHPAQAYNPLFIYGPSGLGKTHLLYAITNELKKKNENIKIIYIKGEDFTNQMIESLSRQAMKEFRDKYRSCDVLLIDDIQFIAGKTSTQEEFFHTFNALYEDSKQIILTSDRPPREIKTLEDRLKTRFEWGLIADIQPPDLELRTAIIKKKADQVNVSIPDDVLSFLAENLRSNIRQIEGAIKKLGAKCFLNDNQKITMEVARSCISELLGGAEPVNVTVDKIFNTVYKKYNIKREDIVSTKRTKDIAAARHVTVYLIRNVTDMSLPNIGRILGRDHSTVLSSLEAIDKKMAQDSVFRAEMEEAVKELKGM